MSFWNLVLNALTKLLNKVIAKVYQGGARLWAPIGKGGMARTRFVEAVHGTGAPPLLSAAEMAARSDLVQPRPVPQNRSSGQRNKRRLQDCVFIRNTRRRLDRACQRALHDLDELEAVLSVLLVEAIEKGDDETVTLLGAAFDEERRRVHDLVDFRMNSMKRVPVLSGGDGKWRQPKLYGSSSNYGRDHSQPLSDKDFSTTSAFRAKTFLVSSGPCALSAMCASVRGARCRARSVSSFGSPISPSQSACWRCKPCSIGLLGT